MSLWLRVCVMADAVHFWILKTCNGMVLGSSGVTAVGSTSP